MSEQITFSILVLVTVGLNTIAQVLLKSGAENTSDLASILNVYLIGGVITYGLSTLIYISVLSKINLSIAYPVVIGLTVISTTVAGSILLKEQVSQVNWIGIGLILSGVSAVAFGKIS